MKRKSFGDALSQLKQRALDHAEAMRENGDTRATQEELDIACMYFDEMCPIHPQELAPECTCDTAITRDSIFPHDPDCPQHGRERK